MDRFPGQAKKLSIIENENNIKVVIILEYQVHGILKLLNIFIAWGMKLDCIMNA